MQLSAPFSSSPPRDEKKKNVSRGSEGRTHLPTSPRLKHTERHRLGILLTYGVNFGARNYRALYWQVVDRSFGYFQNNCMADIRGSTHEFCFVFLWAWFERRKKKNVFFCFSIIEGAAYGGLLGKERYVHI